MSDREQQLEKALRDLLNEPSNYTRQAARELLYDNEPKFCGCCGRMITSGALCGPCKGSD